MSCAEKKRSRRRRRRHFIPMIAAIIGLTAVFGIGSVTLARYVSGEDSNWFQIKPEDFYFTSDLLKPGRSGDQTITLYNWDKDQDYVFFMDIRNWEDDYRITPGDITYQVSTDSAGIISAVDNDTSGTYRISGPLAQTRKLVITVPASAGLSTNRVKVTVKASPEDSGYTKTLSGTFELKEGEETCHAEVEFHNEYIDLLIGVDRGQMVEITWPSWLTPDNTNSWQETAVGNSGSISLMDGSSSRLRFFVTGTRTEDTFTVTAMGTTKPVPIPAK